jgi:hypothetical protein
MTTEQYAAILRRQRAPRRPRKPPSPPACQSEANLLRQVLAWLALRGVPHWRANAGGGLRGKRPIKGNPEGTPDVLAVLPPAGRLCGIECKSARGRERPGQRAWRERAQAAGALCLVVRSLEELIAALAAEGVC